jgi:hypothetical protein
MVEMNIRVFTPDDYPAIVNIHNSLNIVWLEKLEPREPGQRLNGTPTPSASTSAGSL